MIQDLDRYHIKTLTQSKVIEIITGGLKIDQNGDSVNIDADTVVIAAGSLPSNPLEAFLKTTDIDYKTVGDAARVATAFDAIHQGYKSGKEI